MDFFGPQLSTQRFFSPDSGPLHWVIKHILNTAKNESWVIQCGKFNKKCQFNFTEANSWGLDTVQITYIKYYWQNLSVLNSKNCIFFPCKLLGQVLSTADRMSPSDYLLPLHHLWAVFANHNTYSNRFRIPLSYP